MKKPFLQLDGEMFIHPFETKPIEGYKIPTNKETGETLPNCCLFHKEVFEEAKKWFEIFPNCCEDHKKFIDKEWFNKDHYNGIAEKIVRQLSFTEHIISEHSNQPDWYKDITDYIEYNISSFGHPAIGLHLYLGDLKHSIKNSKEELTNRQREKLAEYFVNYYKPSEAPKVDLNLLFSTYQEWLNIFPFELNSYFGNLKKHFETQLPILQGEPEVNKYSGVAKMKIHSQSSFIDELIKITDNLLTQINGVILYENGLITDANKIKLELIISQRKQKLKQRYNYNSPDENTRFRKMIQYWLNDEKKFIDEITPLIKSTMNESPNDKLTNDEQKKVMEAVRQVKEVVENPKDNYTIEHKIDWYKQQIRGAILDKPEDKFTDFFIKKLKQEIAILDGSFDSLYGLKETKFSSTELETKSHKLKEEFSKYGFFDIQKVKPLTEESKRKLVELISSSDLPYCIAMLDFLGYLKHLEKEHFKIKGKLNKEVAKWFNSDKEGRAVKGNISSLQNKTTENKKRYTAYKHKETVQNDYQKLK